VLRACLTEHGPGAGRGVVGLIVALGVLWLASGALARRILRPLREVTAVAEAIGGGDLSARVGGNKRRSRGDDIEHVGRTLNDMADRIQQQLEDQKELLAAVSHEMRTPLGHLRILTEVLKERLDDKEAAHKHIAGIEREVLEMDDLIGQLLAASRLDFRALQTTPQDPVELARRALERAGQPPERLAVQGQPGELVVDASLLLRALANLIENAEKHGGGLVELRVEVVAGEGVAGEGVAGEGVAGEGVAGERVAGEGVRSVRFTACDEGEGFAPGDEDKAFAAFFSRTKSDADGKASLGLGLALVRRIAEGHHGRAFVEAREGRGVCVGIELPL
jgi:signal transduction histidine kinase